LGPGFFSQPFKKKKKKKKNGGQTVAENKTEKILGKGLSVFWAVQGFELRA
jgi:hypothetical protein